jgi:hypothetical protein
LGVVFWGFHLESAETLQTTARWPSQ